MSEHPSTDSAAAAVDVEEPDAGPVNDEPGAETVEHAATDADDSTTTKKSRLRVGVPGGRVLAYGVLPAVALLLAVGAGYLKWLDSSARDAQIAQVESVHAAAEGAVALLSYKPDTVEKDLETAQNRLTGAFKESYIGLTRDVVIPGAKQKQITAQATVPATGSVSATAQHAVVLLFVDQTVTMGNTAPTSTASTVRVTLDKVGGRWLISAFDPI